MIIYILLLLELLWGMGLQSTCHFLAVPYEFQTPRLRD